MKITCAKLLHIHLLSLIGVILVSCAQSRDSWTFRPNTGCTISGKIVKCESGSFGIGLELHNKKQIATNDDSLPGGILIQRGDIIPLSSGPVFDPRLHGKRLTFGSEVTVSGIFSINTAINPTTPQSKTHERSSISFHLDP